MRLLAENPIPCEGMDVWQAEDQASPGTGRPPERDEFERRYDRMPELKKAELLEGVVHMPSPVRWNQYAGPHFDLITWLGVYRASTPGVRGGDNSSLRLDLDNEPQPDAVLIVEPACGGQVRLSPMITWKAAPA